MHVGTAPKTLSLSLSQTGIRQVIVRYREEGAVISGTLTEPNSDFKDQGIPAGTIVSAVKASQTNLWTSQY